MRTVWVTGASSGLGHYTAKALKDAGWRVIAGARSFEGNEGENEEGYRLKLDVTDEKSMDVFVHEAERLSGAPDALVNCAGVLVLGAMEDVAPSDTDRVLRVNLLGQIAMIKRVLPLMRKTKRGHIVNFSSINGLLGIPFQGVYTMSKHAIEGYSEALQMEVSPFGVYVTLVEPGDHRGGSQSYRARAGAKTEEYARAYDSAVAVIARDEAGGLDPARLGEKVARMMARKCPPFRFMVAKGDQRLAVILHKLLPGRLFFRIIRPYYIKRLKGRV